MRAGRSRHRVAWAALAACACARAPVVPTPDPSGVVDSAVRVDTDDTDVAWEPPDILLIVLDDVGPDLTDTYGVVPDAAATPTLSALAARGVSFSRAWATPWCSPTRAALHTGVHPGGVGLGRAIDLSDPQEWTFPQDTPTLPALLREAAPVPYASGLAGKWHLTPLWRGAASAALDAGFDHHFGAVGNLQRNHAFDFGPQGWFTWERVEDGVVARTRTYATTADIDDALALADRLSSPWFVHVGLRAAHFPYATPPEALHGRGVVDDDPFQATRAILEAADTELGRLFATLGADQLDRTVVIVVADNGTTGAARTAPDVAEGKSTVRESGVRVPLIVAGPGIAGGRWDDALVHVVDLMPTVLDAAGVPRGAWPPVDGVSLWPRLVDPGAPAPRAVMTTETFEPNGAGPYTRWQQAARDDRFKLIRDASGERLYDLGAAWTEGEDLLGGPALDADAAAARTRLAAALDGLVRR